MGRKADDGEVLVWEGMQGSASVFLWFSCFPFAIFQASCKWPERFLKSNPWSSRNLTISTECFKASEKFLRLLWSQSPLNWDRPNPSESRVAAGNQLTWMCRIPPSLRSLQWRRHREVKTPLPLSFWWSWHCFSCFNIAPPLKTSKTCGKPLQKLLEIDCMRKKLYRWDVFQWKLRNDIKHQYFWVMKPFFGANIHSCLYVR